MKNGGFLMSISSDSSRGLSTQAVQRMPYYLTYLKKLHQQGVSTVPASVIASEFNLSEIQARKDLAAICRGGGKPRSGFAIHDLIVSIEDILGFNDTSDAVLVGAGHLGQALMMYGGFKVYGLNIIAAFDNNKEKIGTSINQKQILDAEKIPNLCSRMKAHIGIIAVPADCAQHVCDRLVEGGVIGIWNFAPVNLTVPDYVKVQNENMAASLALLSRHVHDQLKREADEF